MLAAVCPVTRLPGCGSWGARGLGTDAEADDEAFVAFCGNSALGTGSDVVTVANFVNAAFGKGLDITRVSLVRSTTLVNAG